MAVALAKNMEIICANNKSKNAHHRKKELTLNASSACRPTRGMTAPDNFVAVSPDSHSDLV